MTNLGPEILVAAATVAAEFGFGRRTIGRRMADPTSGFPAAIRIKGRLYFRRCELEKYKAALIEKALGAAPQATAPIQHVDA
jgi:predicted DNA-binding transcriptional regulator AlpA